jgi:hypothetical protein
MLTRAVFALVLILAAPAAALAETKVLALGLSDDEVSQEELDTGTAPPVPRFNTGAIAYVSAAEVKQGDVVEIALKKDGKPLHRSSETLAEDRGSCCKRANAGFPPAAGPKAAIRPLPRSRATARR